MGNRSSFTEKYTPLFDLSHILDPLTYRVIKYLIGKLFKLLGKKFKLMEQRDLILKRFKSYLIPLFLGLGELLLQGEDVLVQQLVLALQSEGVVRL